MKIKNDLKHRLIIGIILIAGSALLITYTLKNQLKVNINKSEIEYEMKDLISSEQIIKDSFKYKNEHDLDKLRQCYSASYINSDFRLNNIVSTKVLDIKLLKDERNYSFYIGTGNGRINGVKRKNLIIYRVRYAIEFKDQSIEPIDSGEYDESFYLIRENNLDSWKIDAIGVNYFK